MTASKNTFGACCVGAVRSPRPPRRGLLFSFLLGCAPMVDHSPAGRATQARSTLSHPEYAAHTPHNRWVCDARKPTLLEPHLEAVYRVHRTPTTHPRKSRRPRPVVGVCGRASFVVGFRSRLPHLGARSTTITPPHFSCPRPCVEYCASVLGKPTAPSINRTPNHDPMPVVATAQKSASLAFFNLGINL